MSQEFANLQQLIPGTQPSVERDDAVKVNVLDDNAVLHASDNAFGTNFSQV